MLDNSENENPESDLKRHYVENFSCNMNSTAENQITVGQRFHDHVEKSRSPTGNAYERFKGVET